MEASNRTDFARSFRDHDWVEYGYLGPGLRHAKPSNLRENIHPIFSYNKPEPSPLQRFKQRWTTVDGYLPVERWDAMVPALALAFRLLLSPASVRLIYTIMHGHRDPTGLVRHGIPVMKMLRSGLPDAAMRPAVEAALIELSKSISFRVASRDSPWLNAAHGMTRGSLVYYPAGISILPDRKGLASLVAIDERYVDALIQPVPVSQTQYSEDSRVRRTLNANFRFSVTLCHEVMHAVFFACNDQLCDAHLNGDTKARFNEPFLEDQRQAELGFCWENEAFGGVIGQGNDPPHDFLNDPLWLTEFPSWMYWDADVDPTMGLPHQHATRYLVSTHYVQNIQENEFWEAFTIGDQALHIQKSLGIRYANPSTFGPTWPLPNEQWDAATDRVQRNHVNTDPTSIRANEAPDAKIARLMEESYI